MRILCASSFVFIAYLLLDMGDMTPILQKYKILMQTISLRCSWQSVIYPYGNHVQIYIILFILITFFS